MEDLEDEIDDEEFKVPIKKQRRKNVRRSGRLHLAQQKKESGEYFEEYFEVNIKVTDNGNESEEESIPTKNPKMENAQLKKESGEYFEEHFEADIKVTDDRNECDDESDSSDEDNSYIDLKIDNEHNDTDSNSSSDEDIDGYLTKSLKKFYQCNGS